MNFPKCQAQCLMKPLGMIKHPHLSDSFSAEVEYATSEKSPLMSNSLMVKDLQPDFVAFSLNWGTDFFTPPMVKVPSSL